MISRCSRSPSRPRPPARRARLGHVPVFAPADAPRRAIVLLSGSEVGATPRRARARASRRGRAGGGRGRPGAPRARPAAARCAYPAADLETLAGLLQKRAGLPAYQRPLVVGHSLGASVGWAAFAQAPGGTFPGAVLAGFCPGSRSRRASAGLGAAAARREGGEVVPPATHLEQPLTLLSGPDDRECPTAAAEAFAREIRRAFEVLPGWGTAWSPRRPGRRDRAAPPGPRGGRGEGGGAAARGALGEGSAARGEPGARSRGGASR